MGQIADSMGHAACHTAAALSLCWAEVLRIEFNYARWPVAHRAAELRLLRGAINQSFNQLSSAPAITAITR